MFYSIIWWILLSIDSYFIITKLTQARLGGRLNCYMNEKSDKYYHQILKDYENMKKVKLKTKKNIFSMMILKLEKAGIKNSVLMNPISFILFSIISYGISYMLVYHFLKVMLLSAILCLPTLFLPMLVVEWIEEFNTSKIEKATLNFLLQLKNYTQINNDIIYALHEVKTVEPLQMYLDTFLAEMNSGINFELAMQNLKDKIVCEELNNFLSNVQHCYLYGGSFPKLISKSYQMMRELQKEKEKRIAETKSARVVLLILIILDFLVYLVTIKNNHENHLIMQKTIVGNMILYWNFTSMWFLAFMANKVKKLDY